MTFQRLVWRNVASHPVRSGLLFFFAALSLFLFVFLRSIVRTLEEVTSAAASDRLTVESGVGPMAELPASYRDAIGEIDGVELVSRFSWFGGVFRDPENMFPTVAVDLETMLRAYPEVVVSPEQRTALLGERRGCLIGRRLSEKYGLRVGDVLPMIGTLYPLPGDRPWEFVVSAVYRSGDPAFPETLMLFHWDYLEEVRRTLPTAADVGSRVTMYMVRIERGRTAAEVAARIDARYAAGPQRTHTQTEQAHRADHISMLGEIPSYLGWIGGVVLLAMGIAVVNAMAIVAGERGRTVGLLKALGFGDGSAAYLVVLESLLVVTGGGLVGTALSRVSAEGWRRLFGEVLPSYRVAPDTLVLGAVLSIAIGLLGAFPPALRLARVRPLAVLREDA
jgi:putative ABC transport system permease protein